MLLAMRDRLRAGTRERNGGEAVPVLVTYTALRCMLIGQAELDAAAVLSPAVKDETGSGSSKRRRNAAPAAAATAAECIVLDDEDTPAAKRHRGAPEATGSEPGPSQTLAERLAERAQAAAPSAAPPGLPAGPAAAHLALKAAIRAELASGCPAVAQVPAATQGKAAAVPEGGSVAEPAAGQKESASAGAAAEDQEMAADARLDAAMGPGYTLLKVSTLAGCGDLGAL